MDNDRVLIVGGGVIGLSIGWKLARAGKGVVVFDRDRAGGAASWASAGMLSPLAEVRFEEEPLLRLGLKSLAMYPDFVAELEADTGQAVGYRKDGVLLVGVSQDDLADLEFRYRFQKELGLEVAWLNGAEARAREPHLGGQVSAAVWCPGDHQVDNRLLVAALATGLEKAGGTLKEGASVDELVMEGNRVRGVRVGEEVYEGEMVVLSAGCWSGRLPGLPDEIRPPVRPVKGQIIRLQMTDAVRPHTIVWYNRWASSVSVYLAPKDGGHLVVGATSEEMGFDTELTAGGMFELLRAAWEVLPGVYDLPIVETLAGLRPGSRDDAPILGTTAIDGLIMATGHYRKGILLTPMTAHYISELILTGEVSEVIRPFGLERFL
ncbi:MAG: glycine oxidase ThiO [bacterium]|nr:glycine oxidase ThiO [bacterium]